MITIKAEQEELVKKLFKITNTNGDGMTTIKELGNQFLPAQVLTVCWTCPQVVNQFYRKLIALFEGGYEIEKPKVDPLAKAIKEVNEYGNATNDGTGPDDSATNTKKKQKGSNTRTTDTDS